MLSRGYCREEPASSALYPQRNNVRTVSPVEANPALCASSAQLLTRASNSSIQWSHGQQTLLTQPHFQPDFSSKESSCQDHLQKSPNAVHVSDGQKILQNSPLLLKLLTTNNSNDMFPLSQQPKTTPPPIAETSVSSTSSTTLSSDSRQYLDDDQILKLIEEKLAIFRAEMKVLKESGFSVTDSRKMEPTSSCSPQVRPTPSKSASRALDDHIVKNSREKETSDHRRHSPERSRMNNGTAMAKQSTEYVEIMQEAAAICSKKEGESPVVLQAQAAFGALEELVKQRPALTLGYKPSNQEYKSTWRNTDPYVSLDQEVDNLPSGAKSSKLSESTPTFSALETSDSETWPVAEKSRESLPQSSADSEDVRTHLSQNTNSNTDFAEKSSGPDGNVKMVHEQQEFNEETQEKKVQTGEGEMGRGVFDIMYENLNLKYNDITDDKESNITPQISTLDTTLQSKNIHEERLLVQPIGHMANAVPAENVDINLSTSQFPKISMSMHLVEDISDDEGTNNGNGSIQMETSRPPEQNSASKGKCQNAKMAQAASPSPKQQLACTCPYLVETEDGFVEGLCPKCVQDISSLNREEDISVRQKGRPKDYEDAGFASGCSQRKADVDPQSEEDEWLVFPLIASDVKLEQEIVVLDDTENSDEENKYPSGLELPNEPDRSRFQKIQEFDTLVSFLQSKSKEFNAEHPLEPSNTAPSEFLPAICTLSKLEAVDKPVSEPASAHSTEAEDSCDTDDSSDYPLQTKGNHMTVSSPVRAPSPLICISDSAEEREVPQLQETIMPRPPPESPSSINKFFPDISTDEDEDSENSAVKDTPVASTVTERLRNKTSLINKRIKHRKPKKLPDSDDELNQDCNLSDEVSTPPRQLALKPRSRPDQKGQKSASVSSHVHQNQAVKQKGPSTTSTSDHIRNKQEKRKKLPTDQARKISEKPQSEGKMPELKVSVASGHTANHKANTQNVSQTRKRKSVSSQLSQPSLGQSSSTQSNAAFPIKAPQWAIPPLNATLSLNGKQYHASSLPGNKQSQPKPPKSSISKPNQVNSYNTDKSTPAKQNVVREWQENYVPRQRRRRSSYERNTSSSNVITKAATGRDHKMRESTARQRHNSHETLLWKKTTNEAKQLTQQAHCQPSTELNRASSFTGKGYRWKNQNTTDDFDLERERWSPDLPNGLTEL